MWEGKEQGAAAFAKASAFVKTSARQVGVPRRTEGRRQRTEGRRLTRLEVGGALRLRLEATELSSLELRVMWLRRH
jgi:hypothetical protein